MTADPKAIAKEMRAALSALTASTMLEALDAIVAAAPVRTGHLRDNFVLSVGTPHSTETEGPTAQKAGRARVADYNIAKDGPRIFLTNNVGYLQYLKPFVAQALAIARRGPQKSRMFRALAKTSFRRGA